GTGAYTVPAGGGGSGTVTNFTAGDLSPLFTSSVATSTTTPALTFSLSTAGAHKYLGNNTGSTAAPAYSSLVAADIPAIAESGVTNLVSDLAGKQASGTYVTSVTGTAPVVSGGGTTPAISMAKATTSVDGYLSATDWT